MGAPVKLIIRKGIFVETCHGTVGFVKWKRHDGRFLVQPIKTRMRGDAVAYFADELRRVWPTFVGFVAVHHGPLFDLDRSPLESIDSR